MFSQNILPAFENLQLLIQKGYSRIEMPAVYVCEFTQLFFIECECFIPSL